MPYSDPEAFGSTLYRTTTSTPTKSRFESLRDTLAAGQKAAGTAMVAGREPTEHEHDLIAAGVKAAEESRELLRQGDVGRQIAAELYGRGGESSKSGRGFMGAFEPAGRRALADQIVAKMVDRSGPYGSKALTGSGAGTVDIPLLPEVPVAQGYVPVSLLSVVPVIEIAAGATASYLTQTSRTNNAAPVAKGGLKPTSTYGMVRRTADLQVIAHISDPQDRFDLEDVGTLSQFVQLEMVYGLSRAIEAQVLSGDGARPNLRGLVNTSGVQSVGAVAGDLIATLRKGITALETVGHGDGLVFVLSPATWEKAELTRNASGTLDLQGAGPVNRAEQKVWGVPVAVSAQVPAGKALLFSQNALALYVDRQGVRVDWGSPGELFRYNQVVARAEGRFDLAVFQPLGVAVVTLPA